MVLFGRGDRRAAAALQTTRVLYWIYAGRLVVCLGVYGTAVFVGNVWAARGIELAPGTRLLAVAGLGVAALATPVAYWFSHLRNRQVGLGFVFGQALVDVALVTGIVHVTGGFRSPFPALLYIVLASGYALVLPFAAALGLAVGTGIAYLLDLAIGYGTVLDPFVLLQIGIFTIVATATSMIGARLRQIGQELRAVEGELDRLKLDTADILQAIASGVVTLDAEGKVFYMNPAAEQLLAVRRDEWWQREILPELDRRAPGVANVIRQALERRTNLRDFEAEVFAEPVDPADAAGGAGRPQPGWGGREPPRPPRSDRTDAIARPPAPTGTPVSVSTTLLTRPNAPPSLTVHLQDLSIARQLEELRLRAGRLEAVAELSASLAHELKNPLASIRSAVEQLSAREAADEDDRRLGELVLRESDRLDRVLREFGDFARVDVTERVPVDLAALVRHVVEVVRQHPAAERATITWSVETGVEDLWGDAELLHRTLLNLVLNAVQVGAEVGGVNVRIEAESYSPHHEAWPDPSLGLPVRIKVIDDGPGIPPHEHQRIFDPFYTRRKGGSGLGLSIAHRAVQAHGGALFVSSTPGQGATFIMVLPRRARESREDALDPAVLASPAGTAGPVRRTAATRGSR